MIPLSSLAAVPNDPYYHSKSSWQQDYEDQWALKRVGFSEDKKSAWHLADGSQRPVIVAVIDSGLDYHHPDIDKQNIWRNPKEIKNNRDDDGNGYVDDLIGWDFIDNDALPWDRTGHGTFVAGIIAATADNGLGIAGINRGVKIMPLRALNFMGRGRSVAIAAAIYYAVENGAEVINLSLGAKHVSRIDTDAIQYAAKQGVVVVVAVGNEAVSTQGHGLAGMPEVISVGASNLDDQRASFSNWGEGVDLVAPGVDILSLRARRTDLARVAGLEGYRTGANIVGEQGMLYRATGSSFSAPFVTGTASLIRAGNSDLTAEQVKRMIVHSARDIDTPGVDELTGYGLLDAREAVRADPAFFIEARVRSVSLVNRKGKSVLQVSGSANADRMKSAWLDLGKGENPKSWKKVAKSINRPVLDNVLGDIPISVLSRSKQWTLRLTVEHKNGRTRQYQYGLNLE